MVGRQPDGDLVRAVRLVSIPCHREQFRARRPTRLVFGQPHVANSVGQRVEPLGGITDFGDGERTIDRTTGDASMLRSASQ